MSVNSLGNLFQSYTELRVEQASEESFVQWFDAIDFKEREDEKANALWLACADGNQKLVKYIIEHSDKTIVNSIVNGKESILFRALNTITPWDNEEPTKPWEKAMECAQILIDTGADINVRVNISSPTNLLGMMVGSVALNILDVQIVREELSDKSVARDKVKKAEKTNTITKRAAAYLAAKGAKCHIEYLGDVDLEQNAGLVNGDDKVNAYIDQVRDYLAFEALAHHSLPKTFHNFWSKTRLVYLATENSQSPLAMLPREISHLISKKIAELHISN